MGNTMFIIWGRALGCVSDTGRVNLHACAVAMMMSKITKNTTGSAARLFNEYTLEEPENITDMELLGLG